MCIFPKKEKDSEYLLLYYSYFPVAYRYILRTVQGDITRDPTSKFFFRSEKAKKKKKWKHQESFYARIFHLLLKTFFNKLLYLLIIQFVKFTENGNTFAAFYQNGG